MRVTATYEWNSSFQRDDFQLFFGEDEEFPIEEKSKEYGDEKGILFTMINEGTIYEVINTDDYEEIDNWPNPQVEYFYTFEELLNEYDNQNELNNSE